MKELKILLEQLKRQSNWSVDVAIKDKMLYLIVDELRFLNERIKDLEYQISEMKMKEE